MNPLHLLWIIPLSATFGFAIAAILIVGGRGEHGDRGGKK